MGDECEPFLWCPVPFVRGRPARARSPRAADRLLSATQSRAVPAILWPKSDDRVAPIHPASLRGCAGRRSCVHSSSNLCGCSARWSGAAVGGGIARTRAARSASCQCPRCRKAPAAPPREGGGARPPLRPLAARFLPALRKLRPIRCGSAVAAGRSAWRTVFVHRSVASRWTCRAVDRQCSSTRWTTAMIAMPMPMAGAAAAFVRAPRGDAGWE